MSRVGMARKTQLNSHVAARESVLGVPAAGRQEAHHGHSALGSHWLRDGQRTDRKRNLCGVCLSSLSKGTTHARQLRFAALFSAFAEVFMFFKGETVIPLVALMPEQTL